MDDFRNWFIIGAGLFSVAGGVFQWGFFMDSRKAQGVVKLFGRQGARVFYVCLGLFVVGLGTMIMLGMLPEKGA